MTEIGSNTYSGRYHLQDLLSGGDQRAGQGTRRRSRSRNWDDQGSQAHWPMREGQNNSQPVVPESTLLLPINEDSLVRVTRDDNIQWFSKTAGAGRHLRVRELQERVSDAHTTYCEHLAAAVIGIVEA